MEEGSFSSLGHVLHSGEVQRLCSHPCFWLEDDITAQMNRTQGRPGKHPETMAHVGPEAHPLSWLPVTWSNTFPYCVSQLGLYVCNLQLLYTYTHTHTHTHTDYLVFYLIFILYWTIVLISGVQQSDSAIHIYIFFFFRYFPKYIITELLQSRVPCAIRLFSC